MPHRFGVTDLLRILRSALRDGCEPELTLSAIRDLRCSIDQIEADAVRQCVDNGMTMPGVAVELGVTKQAVHKRWGHLWTPQTESENQND